jgi:hypothetical protein
VTDAGCFNDVHILNEVMKLAKKGPGLVAVQLDISKAFDTVPHQAIEGALLRKGVPVYVAKLIRGSYGNVRTVITTGTSEAPIQIRRGVKQGDLLSHFIFNALMEPLLLDWEQHGGIRISKDHSVSSLAFPDDTILLASDGEEAKRQLAASERYLDGLNMLISVHKCRAFRILPTKDSWYLEDPALETVRGDKIPYADAKMTIRYLGGKISPGRA